MFQPTERFRAWFRQQLSEQRLAADNNDWVRMLAIKNQVLPIDVYGLMVWFVGVDGSVYSADLDTHQPNLEPTAMEEVARAVLLRASSDFPELRELLEDQGASRSTS